MSELCPYCDNEYIKMLDDTGEYVCSFCGHIRDSEEYKPGVLSEKYE